MSQFINPNFSKGGIEFRVVGNEVCVYATSEGLKKLSSFCEKLIDDKKTGHIHLEDYEVLTEKSLGAVLAIVE
jgi:hypothetical protein